MFSACGPCPTQPLPNPVPHTRWPWERQKGCSPFLPCILRSPLIFNYQGCGSYRSHWLFAFRLFLGGTFYSDLLPTSCQVHTYELCVVCMRPVKVGLLCAAVPASDQPTLHTGAAGLGRSGAWPGSCVLPGGTGPRALLSVYPPCCIRHSSRQPGHTHHLGSGNKRAPQPGAADSGRPYLPRGL